MPSSSTTVTEYLASLPAERRAVVSKVRAVVRKHLPGGYKEVAAGGGIAWVVPLSRYPETYNGQPLMYAALAAHKNSYSLYLMGVYGDAALEKWWRDAYAKAGRKLDMGKSCVRFKSLDALPLDVVGECIARVPVDAFIDRYEKVKRTKRA